MNGFRLKHRRRDLLRFGLFGGLYSVVAGDTFLRKSAAADDRPTLKVPKLHQVPLGYEGVDSRHLLWHRKEFPIPRGKGQVLLELHDMDRSSDGRSIWFWGGRRAKQLVRYDVTTGKTDRHPIALDESRDAHDVGSHLYPLNKSDKVYLINLAQASRMLPIYHPDAGNVTFARLPGATPLKIITGIVDAQGPFLYLFPQEPRGVIQWDTLAEEGRLFPYPYDGPGPVFGSFGPDGRSLWCPIWDGNAVASFDIRTGRWAGHWRTPFDANTQPTLGSFLGQRYYTPDLLKPQMLVFDTDSKRWLQPIPIPGHNERFGVLGNGYVYAGKVFCSMNTYKGYIPPGGPVGVDGKPHHFLDRNVCIDVANNDITHFVCQGDENEYWISCFRMVLGKHLYVISFNAMQSDGTVNQFHSGPVSIFQTHPAGHPEADVVMQDAPIVNR